MWMERPSKATLKWMFKLKELKSVCVTASFYRNWRHSRIRSPSCYRCGNESCREIVPVPCEVAARDVAPTTQRGQGKYLINTVQIGSASPELTRSRSLPCSSISVTKFSIGWGDFEWKACLGRATSLGQSSSPGSPITLQRTTGEHKL